MSTPLTLRALSEKTHQFSDKIIERGVNESRLL